MTTNPSQCINGTNEREKYYKIKQIIMESLRIEIINPKAKRLLKNLADIGLIKITEEQTKSDFSEILNKLRSKSGDVLSLEEITKEVESVRKERNEKL